MGCDMKTEPKVREYMNREEMDKVLARIADHQRAVDMIEVQLNRGIDALKAQAAEGAKEHLAAIEKDTAALKAAAVSVRAQLFELASWGNRFPGLHGPDPDKQKLGLGKRAGGTNKALLLKHLNDNSQEGSKLSELCQVLPSLSATQVKTLLRDMKMAGTARVVGHTNAARWFPPIQIRCVRAIYIGPGRPIWSNLVPICSNSI